MKLSRGALQLTLVNSCIATYVSRPAAYNGTNGSNGIVSLPREYTYLLPDGFQGNANYTFANGTHTSNTTINNALKAASQAPFISYDQEFLDILGPKPDIKLVQQRNGSLFAFEGGIWVPERNQIWFTSTVYQSPAVVNVLDLATDSVYQLNGTKNGQVLNPNGGYYFEGKVYFGTYQSQNLSYSGGIVSVDVKTLEVQPVLNSYFGLRLNGPDDIVWVTQTRGPDKGKKYMFFSELALAQYAYESAAAPLQVPTSLWRWDPQEKILIPIITRNELAPNGVRVSPDMRTLYVSDSSPAFLPSTPSAGLGAGVSSWLGPFIYKYDLDEEMYPINRRVVGEVREGLADGMHVDDAGRIWTGESEGITVRTPKGKVLGTFNAQYFLQDKESSATPLANFALAGDTLVVLATTKLYTIKLGQVLVSKNSTIVN